jgi:hypothetical protein
VIIESEGLFSGERLAACSDLAQLYWPRFYIGSNGFARLELSYASIISKIFGNFSKVPKSEELWDIFREYEANFLAVLYEANGVWWCQFSTSEKYLPRYKTRRDSESPAPPAQTMENFRKGYIAWKSSKSLSSQSFQKSSEDFARRGEGVGVGEGVGEGIELSLLSPAAPAETGPRPEEFANAWNRLRGKLPKVDSFTEGRRKKVKARLAQGLTLDRFAEAVENCRGKPFLSGVNDSGWTATFDWLVANGENVEKAINNPYGLTGNGAHANGNSVREGNDERIARINRQLEKPGGDSDLTGRRVQV